jgi:hypothetical protein
MKTGAGNPSARQSGSASVILLVDSGSEGHACSNDKAESINITGTNTQVESDCKMHPSQLPNSQFPDSRQSSRRGSLKTKLA